MLKKLHKKIKHCSKYGSKWPFEASANEAKAVTAFSFIIVIPTVIRFVSFGINDWMYKAPTSSDVPSKKFVSAAHAWAYTRGT